MVNANPTWVFPPRPSTVTATDGIMRAKADPLWAGVFLTADFTGQARVPLQCRFVRGWDGQIVRGGDPARVVSNIAYCYEHEAPLGVTNSWYAIPLYSDGTLGAPTAAVPLSVGAPVGGSSDPSTWIKSIEFPGRSVQAMIDSWPSFSYTSDAEADRPLGRENPMVSYDVMSGITTQAKFRTMTRESADSFENLCRSGGVLLFQTSERYYRPSFYAVCSNLTREDQAHYWDTQITWTLDLVEVDRPGTAGSISSTPGYTLADRYARYPTFADVPPRTFREALPY